MCYSQATICSSNISIDTYLEKKGEGPLGEKKDWWNVVLTRCNVFWFCLWCIHFRVNCQTAFYSQAMLSVKSNREDKQKVNVAIVKRIMWIWKILPKWLLIISQLSNPGSLGTHHTQQITRTHSPNGIKHAKTPVCCLNFVIKDAWVKNKKWVSVSKGPTVLELGCLWKQCDFTNYRCWAVVSVQWLHFEKTIYHTSYSVWIFQLFWYKCSGW